MSISKRVFKNVFWLVFSEVSSRVLIFIGIAYLARVLGSAGFGLYSLSVAAGVYFWAIVDMGVTGYGTREVARNKEAAAELFAVLTSLRLVLAIILFTIFAGVLYLLDMPVEKKYILLAGCFYGVSLSISGDWVFRGLEKMQYIFSGRMATSIIFLVGVYFFVNSHLDTLYASAIYSFSFLVGSFVFCLFLYEKFEIRFAFNISLSKWLYHVKRSFYFAINGMVSNISIFVPIFFMGLWSTNGDIGIFSAPHRLIAMIIRMGGLITLSIYPTLSSLYFNDKDSYKKTHMTYLKFILGMSVPLCILASSFGNDIIVLVFGQSYTASIGIFNIMVWFSLLVILERSLSIALLSAGYQKLNTLAVSIGTIIIIFLSIVLIPKYSSYGAVWALLGGEILSVIIINVIFVKKIYRLNLFNPDFMKILFVGALMGLLIMELPFPKGLNALIGIMAYGLILLRMGIVDNKLIKILYHRYTGG